MDCSVTDKRKVFKKNDVDIVLTIMHYISQYFQGEGLWTPTYWGYSILTVIPFIINLLLLQMSNFLSDVLTCR